MMALTIWQPWASLIIVGAKPDEFRQWCAPRAHHGSRIGIHAAKRPIDCDEIKDLLVRLDDADEAWTTGLKPDLARPVLEAALRDPRSLPMAAILGTAILGQPVPARQRVPAGDSARVDHHRWAWPLTAIERFPEPFPARGAQGFWRMYDAAEAAAQAGGR